MPTITRNRAEQRRARIRAFREAFMLAQEYSTQGAAYRDKEDEAQRWLAAASPDIANFPFIAAETGITAPTAAEVAQLFRQKGIARRTRWAELETIRATLLAEIGSAVTVAQQLQAYGRARDALIAWTQDNADLVRDRVLALLNA